MKEVGKYPNKFKNYPKEVKEKMVRKRSLMRRRIKRKKTRKMRKNLDMR